MLDDRARTQAFIEALEEVVRPDDVVVDVGTGTGVLAIAAARAGARHVYAIEEGSIADAAQALVTANGLDSRITIVRGRSTRVELPERATLLVSETIGNDPLDEGIIEILRDARARLLTANARTLPKALSVHALPVDLPDEFLGARRFANSAIERWMNTYGIDFTSLARYGGEETRVGSVAPTEAAPWSVLGSSLALAQIDFTSAEHESDVSSEGDLEIIRAAVHLGIIVYFNADLSEHVQLSTDPRTTATTSWKNPVYYAAARPNARPGDRVHVSWAWRAGRSVLVVR
jgi:hypothetical protein